MSAERTSFIADGGFTPSSIAAHSAPCFMRWREQWALGIEPIDTDNRMLCALIERIARDFCGNHFGAGAFAATPDGTDRPCLPEIGLAADRESVRGSLMLRLHVLGEHVRAHFAREEALMRANDYPDIAAHQREHRLMLAEYVDLLRDVDHNVGDGLDLETLRSLKRWLLGHLLDTDRRLAEYLHGLDCITRH
jgi:hemerythrin